jgi:hypothetical protein
LFLGCRWFLWDRWDRLDRLGRHILATLPDLLHPFGP